MEVSRLRQLFEYRDNDGFLIRKVGRNTGKRAGSDRVTDKDAYRVVYVEGVYHYEHRIIWALVSGSWPEDQIDHRDGNGLNNRSGNLRSASGVQNKRNTSHQKNSPGIILGVKARGSKFIARIGLNGGQINLGSFSDQFDAICARKSAEASIGFSPNHGRRRKPSALDYGEFDCLLMSRGS